MRDHNYQEYQKEIPEICLLCEGLGNITNVKPTDHWFVTITPDPESGRYSSYDEISAECQAKRIIKTVKEVMIEWKQDLGTTMCHLHWELNAHGMIHAHGIMTLDPGKGTWELNKSRVGRGISRVLGRRHLSYKICCLLLDAEQMDYHYVNKENVFKPNLILVTETVKKGENIFQSVSNRN